MSILLSGAAVALACGGAEFSAGIGVDADGSSSDGSSSDVALADGGDDASHDASDGGSESSFDARADGLGESGITEGGTIDAVAPCAAASTCVPDAPPNWSGPIQFYQGLSSSPRPACPAGWAPPSGLDALSGLVAPAANCTTCTCDSPSGSTCSLPVVTFYSDGACASSCGQGIGAGSSCTTFSVAGCNGGNPHGTVSDTHASGGSCAASTGITTVPAYSWNDESRGCTPNSALPQSTCKVNQVCMPNPASPFVPAACVVAQGEVACPGGPYGNGTRYVVYTGATDTRGCSSCACGSPSGVTCTGAEVDLFVADVTCTSSQKTLSAPTPCTGGVPTGVSQLTLKTAATAGGGSCAASGGQPTGDVTPTGASTVCCL